MKKTPRRHTVRRAQRRARSVAALGRIRAEGHRSKTNMRSCPSASPKTAAGSRQRLPSDCCRASRRTKPRPLRAGDPEATPGAAVLASGEAIIVPPDACIQPVGRSLHFKPSYADPPAPADPPSTWSNFSRSARHVWRRRHHPGTVGTGGHSLRGRGRARLRRGHGQGRDEALFAPPACPS